MKKIVAIFIFVSAVSLLNAQVEIITDISKDAVMIGEPFKVEYKMNKSFDDFNLVADDNFEIVSGPSTSFQQSINMTNGKMEKTTSVTYTYFFKAKKAGKQSVPTAEIKMKRNFYYSVAKDIIVIDAEYHDPNEHKIKDIEGTSKL